jgi:hypothetical protein
MGSSHARRWVNAVVIQKVVKADTDFAGVAGRVSGGSKPDKQVHFVHEAIVRACQSEADLALPHPRFEVVEKEQGLSIHDYVDAAIAFAIFAGGDLNAFEQVREFCRPFNDGVLTERLAYPDPRKILR